LVGMATNKNQPYSHCSLEHLVTGLSLLNLQVGNAMTEA